MRLFIAYESPEETNPVATALTMVALLNTSTVIAELAEEADVIVTNNNKAALGFLKDFEEVRVLIALPPGRERESVEVGAKSLAKSFPNRVYARPMLEREGEQNIVFFLINISEELKK